MYAKPNSTTGTVKINIVICFTWYVCIHMYTDFETMHMYILINMY